jgi:hypothetical protein
MTSQIAPSAPAGHPIGNRIGPPLPSPRPLALSSSQSLPSSRPPTTFAASASARSSTAARLSTPSGQQYGQIQLPRH